MGGSWLEIYAANLLLPCPPHPVHPHVAQPSWSVFCSALPPAGLWSEVWDAGRQKSVLGGKKRAGEADASSIRPSSHNAARGHQRTDHHRIVRAPRARFLLGWQSSLKLSDEGGESHSCECTNRYLFEYPRTACNNHYDQEPRLGCSRSWSPSTQLLSGALLTGPTPHHAFYDKSISLRTLKCTMEAWPCCAEGSLSLSNSHNVTSRPLPRWWFMFLGAGMPTGTLPVSGHWPSFSLETQPSHRCRKRWVNPERSQRRVAGVVPQSQAGGQTWHQQGLCPCLH